MSAQLFKPSKELTFATVQSNCNKEQCYLEDAKISNFCLDLCEVERCDSAGLAFLIETKRMCDRYKKTFAITGMPESIDALAKFCGVDGILREVMS